MIEQRLEEVDLFWTLIIGISFAALLGIATILGSSDKHPMFAPDQVQTAEQYRDIVSFFVSRGWQQVGQNLTFTLAAEGLVANFEITSLGYNQLDTARFSVRHEQAPPEDIQIFIADARDFFNNQSSTLYAIIPNTLRGTFIHGDVNIKGMMAPLFLQIYKLQDIAKVPRCSSFETRTFELRSREVSLDIVFPELMQRNNETAPQLWQRSLTLLEKGLPSLTRFSAALAWRGQSLKQVMEGVMDDQDASRELKHEASEVIARFSSPQELFDRACDRNRSENQRGLALKELIERESHSALAAQITKLALEQDLVLMRLLSRYAPDHVARQLRSADRIVWFNAIFNENIGLETRRLERVLSELDATFLLEPELSSRARNIILTNMLVHDSSDSLEELLRALLLKMDEEALVDLLQTLQSHPSSSSARALVALANDPRQIDKHQEFQVLLGAIKSHLTGYKESFEHAGVEKFLCDCVLHEDRQIASMALTLLREIGSLRAVDALAKAISKPELSLPTQALGNAIQTIRQRIGDTSDRFSGGLSLAEAAGGELTVVAEAGALTDAERRR